MTALPAGAGGLVQIAFEHPETGAQLVMARGRVLERDRQADRDGAPSYGDWRPVAIVEGSGQYRHARILRIAQDRGYLPPPHDPTEPSAVIVKGQLAPASGQRVPVIVEAQPGPTFHVRQDKGGGLEADGDHLLSLLAIVTERDAADPAVVALHARLEPRILVELGAMNPPHG